MRVYHGTTTWKMASLFDGDFSKRLFGLYVTDTWERAARYANSQASLEVTTRTLPLSSCAVVVSIEAEDPIQWSQRSNATSLDQVETTINSGRIVEMSIGRPGSTSYTEQRHIQEAYEKLPDIPIHILDPLMTIHNQ